MGLWIINWLLTKNSRYYRIILLLNIEYIQLLKLFPKLRDKYVRFLLLFPLFLPELS